MKKERREVVLPQNGRNKEENKGMLEEVYLEIEKSRKRMSKFLGIVPYPAVFKLQNVLLQRHSSPCFR